MPQSLDDDIVAAAPVLEPLLVLAGSASLSWKATSSSSDGFAVSEVPSVPDLNIPLKCFRTRFTVEGDVDTLADAIVNEEAVRACDPTLKDIRILNTEHCNTLLYTSYISPSPWLISPRDFCVTAASVIATPDQLLRVCPETPAIAFPEYLRNSLNDLPELHSTARNAVLIQNSKSTTSPLCPPNTEGSPAYIRGFVHCYGYLAWPDHDVVGKLHVTNYCCVDACGSIPKWLVAAAVDQNTQKLRRLKKLVEERTKARKVNPTTTAVAATSDSRRTTGEEVIYTPPVQPAPPAAPPSPSQSATTPREASASQERRFSGSASLHETLENLSSTLPLQPPHRSEPMEDGTLVGVQTPGTIMSALSETLSATPPQSCPLSPPVAVEDTPTTARGVRPTQLPSDTRRKLFGERERHAASSSLANSDASPFLMSVQPLAELARAHGWHTLREVDSIEYSELHNLPASFASKSDLCVALRVSTNVSCSIDRLADVLRSPALAPEVDPEIVRLVAAPSTQSPTHRSVSRHREEDVTREDEARTGASECAVPAHESTLSTTSQLRHYVFNAQSPFSYAWDAVLQCAHGELTPREGGQLGFHTAGVPGCTYIWLGTTNRDVDDDARSPFRSKGRQRMHFSMFGLVAVAIPRSASTVRVSHFVLFDASRLSKQLHEHGADSRFGVRKQKKAAADFLAAVHVWMGQRMGRLRSVCEAHQLQWQRESMVSLDAEPLLRFLYNIHCSQQVMTPGERVRTVGDVTVRQSTLISSVRSVAGDDRSCASGSRVAASASSTGESQSSPLLFVFSLRFPCALSHLRSYMQATATRSRYALCHEVTRFEELPCPPHFNAIALAVRSPNDTSSVMTAYTYLETFGDIEGGGDVPHPTFVLSRVNCEGPQRVSKEQFGDSSSILHGCLPPGNEDGCAQTGIIYCSGWVAVSLDDDEEESTAAASARPSSSSGTPRRQKRLSLLSMARRRGEQTPSSARSNDSTHSRSARHTRGIVVTQYSCVDTGVPLRGDADGSESDLDSALVNCQAQTLQRFRDAVCSWSAT